VPVIIFYEVPEDHSQRHKVEIQKAEITCSATEEMRKMFFLKDAFNCQDYVRPVFV